MGRFMGSDAFVQAFGLSIGAFYTGFEANRAAARPVGYDVSRLNFPWYPSAEVAEIKAGDVHKLKAGRPAGYPEPIVDHAAERLEALRRYKLLGGTY